MPGLRGPPRLPRVRAVNGEKFGIWGGLSERERRRLRRQRALAARHSRLNLSGAGSQFPAPRTVVRASLTPCSHFFDPARDVIILLVVLLFFGGSQLPKLAKNLGKAQQEFK